MDQESPDNTVFPFYVVVRSQDDSPYWSEEIIKMGWNVELLCNSSCGHCSKANGVIKWLGYVDNVPHAGIEFERPFIDCPTLPVDVQYFRCKPGYSILAPLKYMRENKWLVWGGKLCGGMPVVTRIADFETWPQYNSYNSAPVVQLYDCRHLLD